MRTINFTEEDIKKSKLALVNQNLDSLQSAFLMQYITNLEATIYKVADILKKIDLDKYVYTKTRQKEIIKDLLEILEGENNG